MPFLNMSGITASAQKVRTTIDPSFQDGIVTVATYNHMIAMT